MGILHIRQVLGHDVSFQRLASSCGGTLVQEHCGCFLVGGLEHVIIFSIY